MSNNSYNDFKNGIKSDIKETGASLLLIGGLMLLALILLSAILFAIKSKSADATTRFWAGGSAGIISLLLIFSPTARGLIAKIWIVSIVMIPILFIMFLSLYLIYQGITAPIQ